ncbi:GrpB family protein [Frondihabitans australicus]|uniref:GrpB family protein n=1 Tax=Frondihabitans australicus TaxID=386892 RepID=UPI0014728E56|nr:GrpB family protein [Frondihabitans australicus]
MSKAHTEVHLVPADPAWSSRFARTKEQLTPVFLGAEIEHVGSTSVPGLASKDTIDVAVGVRNVDDALTPAILDRLAGLGFDHVASSFADDPDHAFLQRIVNDHRTDHVHVMRVGSEAHTSHLLFRDYLQSHPDACADYEREKRRLAEAFEHDRDGYVVAKQQVVEAILVAANDWRARRP